MNFIKRIFGKKDCSTIPQNSEVVEHKGPKILIIRFSSIGDIVLTTPVIRCVKKQVPNAEVHFLTKYSFRSILENNPYIDKLHVLDEDLNSVIANLQKENFDYVIDLHHNLRTLKVKKAL